MSAPSLARRGVAALYFERQQLDRPRARRLTAASLESFVGDVCGLQIDSVNVVDRAHHLTLWSRFGEYDRDALEALIVRRRVVFEYMSHVACYVVTRDLPLWRATMASLAQPWRRWTRWHDENRQLVDSIEREVAKRGPVGSNEFKGARVKKSSGWWDWQPANIALDYLWKSGRIAVHSRRNFQKLYAPMARVLPQAAEVAPLSLEELSRERMLRSLAAMGAAPFDDLQRYWTWPQWKAPAQRATLDELLGEGRIRELRVEGQRLPWYARAEDIAALERAARVRRPSQGTTLLSPFDSFLWHRERVLRLLGFHYRIEIYVPGHKRTHGYYTMPILHEGQLIGRVDPKTHRDRGVLEARRVHFEPWFAAKRLPPAAQWGRLDRDGAIEGLAVSLRSLATFVGAREVELGRVTPPALRAPLAKALGVAAPARSAAAAKAGRSPRRARSTNGATARKERVRGS